MIPDEREKTMKVRTDLKAGSDYEFEEIVYESDSIDLGEMGEEPGMNFPKR